MSPHYFSEKPGGKETLFKIKIKVRGLELEIYSAPGIFSHQKLDFGTRVLIENMIIVDNSKMLDLGTGYGIVGIVYGILSPNSFVTMVDINERAVKVAKLNVKKLGLQNCRVIKSNLFEKIPETFDNIIVNPPISAGLKVCYKLIDVSIAHLKQDGLFQLVARHKKGGRRLMEKIIETAGNCEVIAKSSGYWVYVARKK
ncbi:MAG: class I SAM-dependent methyltransferase [Candidatus Odinarchaeota archaeon]|nr:class I SAM-dependent methyltransferase [Candidatus Odinarchaeota archaeon]